MEIPTPEGLGYSPRSGADGRSFLQGRLVRIGNVVFGAAESLGIGGEARPLGTLEREENFVEVAVPVFSAAEG